MNDFDKGFEFSARHATAVPAGMDATSWVNSVEAAIEELYSAMNSYDHYKNSKAAQDSLKGFLAEEWAFGTANVDAAVKRVDAKGIRLDSHDLGSADVAWGADQYQLKFLTDPKNIARKLATTLRDSYNGRPKRYADLSFDEWAVEKGFAGKTPDDLLYGDMGGLIPSDKLEAAKQYTLIRIERAKGRGLDEEVRRWTKVRDNLTDRIKTPEGVEGRPATNEEMRRKAIDVSSKKKLDPADDGMTTSQLIAASDIVKQSLKAGGTAAALSVAPPRDLPRYRLPYRRRGNRRRALEVHRDGGMRRRRQRVRVWIGDRGNHGRSSKGRLRRDGKGRRNGIEGRERHRVARRTDHGDVPKLLSRGVGADRARRDGEQHGPVRVLNRHDARRSRCRDRPDRRGGPPCAHRVLRRRSGGKHGVQARLVLRHEGVRRFRRHVLRPRRARLRGSQAPALDARHQRGEH